MSMETLLLHWNIVVRIGEESVHRVIESFEENMELICSKRELTGEKFQSVNEVSVWFSVKFQWRIYYLWYLYTWLLSGL